jgi:hypothetical protein
MNEMRFIYSACSLEITRYVERHAYVYASAIWNDLWQAFYAVSII